jgi:hypothetical protein
LALGGPHQRCASSIDDYMKIVNRQLWTTFMTITVSQQQGKKINITFRDEELEKSFVVDKSDEFLECVNALPSPLRQGGAVWRNAQLSFADTGLLTERIIRVIILGLSF